jgi:tetratricopeptide (TPR) repeat protein
MRHLYCLISLLLAVTAGAQVQLSGEISPEAKRIADTGIAQLLRDGKPNEAVESFARTLSISPRFGNAWAWKGRAHAALGEHKEAIHCWEKFMEFEPNNALPHVEMSYSYFAMRNYAKAEEQFERAIRLEPNNPAIYGTRLTMRFSIGQYESAFTDVETYRSLAGNPRAILIFACQAAACFGRWGLTKMCLVSFFQTAIGARAILARIS